MPKIVDEPEQGKRGPKPWSEGKFRARTKVTREELPQKRDYCHARKSDGTKCESPAGFKTNHPGYGCCNRHGGTMKNAAKSAAVAMVADMALAAGFTDQVEIAPEEALMMLVRIKAGEIRFYTLLIQQLEEEVGDTGIGLLEAPVETETTRPLNLGKDGEDPTHLVTEVQRSNSQNISIWIRLRNEAQRDLAKFSLMAINAGVANRLVAIEERQAELIAASVMGILKDLGHTIDERVLPIVRRHLERLDDPNVIEAKAL